MSENEPDFEEARKEQRSKNIRSISRSAESVRDDVFQTMSENAIHGVRDEVPEVSMSLGVLKEYGIITQGEIDDLRNSVKRDADLVLSAMDNLDPGGELDDHQPHESDDVEDEEGGTEYGTSDYLASSIAATSDMLSEISALQTRLSSFSGSIKGRVANAANSVIGWLKNLEQKIRNNIGNKLWNLVSSYVNLDSWSIFGDAGVNLLGLQGNVGIQVNFTN